MYISLEIQNLIIKACNKIIKKTVDKMNIFKCFPILVDETTDTSQRSNYLHVRYLDCNNVLNEDCLQFSTTYNLTGNFKG